MSASVTENISRRLMNPGISQVHKDVTDERYRELPRPRKVRFFVNGDRFFQGKKLYITPHKYYNFNDLLNDLTGKLPSSINLPYGVRQIFTPVGGRRISDIEDLQDGETYVCAGFEGFKTIKYGRTELEPWSVGKSMRPLNTLDGELGAELSYGSYKYRGYVANAFHPGRYYRSNGNPPNRRWPGAFASTNQRFPAGLLGGPMEAGHLKPKVITIVRNGSQPLSNVKILLNRRSVLSFEQLLADITEAFGSKWRKNRVCKMFTTHGREVKGVADFFREEDCFIAVGNEGLSERDVADIIEELYPDSAYAKVLLKDWDKQRRHNNNKGGLTNRESEQGDKRDSGFVDGSDSNSNSHREQDYASPPAPRQSRLRRSKRAAAAALTVSTEPDSSASFEAISPQNDHHFLNKLERERLRVANDERDKARKRQHRVTEQERRTLDDERRRRGLPPLNPLKPLEDIPRKDVREKEREDGQRKKEEMKKVEEEEEEEEDKEAEKMRKEREEAERAARERMAAAEKGKADKKRMEKVEAEKENRNENEKKVEKEHVKEYNDGRAEKAKDEQTGEKIDQPRDNPVKVETTIATVVTEEKDKERKRKRDNAGEKEVAGRKAKVKVVRRSRAERQVANDTVVTERYDLGRTMGDGNFAIVRWARHRATGQEFAMKVIDKPKLKGKEHMVENEIDIMKDCNHPNIVKLYEEYETADKIYLVMELVKGGDLFDAITQSVKFGEVDSAHMVKNLCNALFYLHSRSIVHRDLKPENLLVHRNKDTSITLKLADFGLAMEVKELIFTVCGTPTYVAPEILTESGYGLEVDMWAVGVITYILLCGFPPFRSPDRNQTELFEYIKAGAYEFLSPYWDNVSESAKDLIRRLLVVDKSKRYTAVDVLSHPWIVCGGNNNHPLPGISSVSNYCKEVRRDLEEQAKHNYESYQRLKEKKRRDE